jgi:predicted ATPase
MKGLTPLVGREHELGLLQERWAQVKDGLGQAVLLSGEAGIGKSRLVQALTEHLAGETYTRIECRCSPYYQNTALYPVVAYIQRLLRFNREEPAEERLRKLEEALRPYGFAFAEVVPLLAALLSLPLPARYPALTLTPQRQKQKTLEALLAWLLAEAERQPVCFVVEDLHWADASTLEWLSLLIDQVSAARLLVLLLFHGNFRPPWAMRSHLTHLTLSRLTRRQVEIMAERVAGGKALPAEVLQQLVAKTDGVPLFVEELTKMVLESGLVKEREGCYALTEPLPPLAIPATLHDSLMARLDRLETAKQVVQLGAVLGREFAYELIQGAGAAASGSGSHPGGGAGAVAAVRSDPAGGGGGACRSGRGRATSARRDSDGARGQREGRSAGGGVSAAGHLVAAPVASRYGPGGSLLPAGPGHCPAPAGQVLGTARGHESESPVATPGQARCSLPDARRDIWLVHRRF